MTQPETPSQPERVELRKQVLRLLKRTGGYSIVYDDVADEIFRLFDDTAQASDAENRRLRGEHYQIGLQWRSQFDAVHRRAMGAEARCAEKDAALRQARGWLLTCSESAQARKDLKQLDAALAAAPNAGGECSGREGEPPRWDDDPSGGSYQLSDRRRRWGIDR